MRKRTKSADAQSVFCEVCLTPLIRGVLDEATLLVCERAG